MARFFLPQTNIHGQRGFIDGQELAHLQRVLRLAPGDRITVFDERGWEHEAVIQSLTAERGEIEILRSSEATRESSLDLTLALGLTKGEKMDLVVEKATELGVRSILPFTSTHAVPKFDATKAARRSERWRKIALSAAKQCGRTQVPAVLPLCDFPTLLSRPEPAFKLLFWESESQQSLQQAYEKHSTAEALLLTVGPEGGFRGEEVELARASGFETAHLGRRILRAETAAVAAVTLAQFLWGDLAERLPR
ncbi:MAG TPA: 16S rRNA (uracil(1498)-N(3))-methyltransferase [Candidatus Limnocylindria bacterium]|nr:16S rRNA (uracil(1498)-N(3))-methyltransferase [Candidatus Limnocylindria bacterium]